jgi:ABC-type Fe3+-hydroxamate transport system substrate-binding protein
VVSLVPSLTELFCDLGLTRYLVGRTGYCIHPKGLIQRVPKVGGTKTVNLKKIRALAPTHVLLNKDENRLEDVRALQEFVPNLVITHPQTVQDNFALFDQFGEVFDVQAAACALSQRLNAELALNKLTTWSSAKALYLIWRNPWMTISPSTYIASMLQQVGLEVVGPWLAHENVSSDTNASMNSPSTQIRYPAFTDAEVSPWGPQVILFSSEPYAFASDDFEATAQWAKYDVPRQLIDGEMLSWFGSRAIPGLQYLRKFRHALQP